MDLFSREQCRPGGGQARVPGPGLALTSALDRDGCLRALRRTLLSFRVPEYTHLPAFTQASWAWNGEPGQAPEMLLICGDRAGDYVLVALWPDSRGCHIGLLPLGADQAGGLECSLLTAWRQRDISLSSSTGGLAAGLVTLVPPVLPPGWVAEIVSAAGYRPTRRNTQMAARAAGSLFLGRAGPFIEHRKPRAARRFVRRHSRRQPMNEAALQEIIDDLARLDPGVLPYLQWLPVRTRAMMLELVQDRGTFWDDLDR